VDDASPLDAPETDEAETTEPEAPIVDLPDGYGDTTTGIEPEPEAAPAEPELTAAPLAAPLDPEPEAVIVPTPVSGGVTPLRPKPYSKFLDETGNQVTADIFRDDNPMFTYVVTTQRVYEEWLTEGFHTPQSRLVYPRGAHVPRNIAADFLAHLDLL
jgi:hypothetical protein